MRLEAAGHRILKLNTGNPAAFGFECPPEILEDILRNVGDAHGYGDAKGLLSARRAVMQHYQTQGIDLDVEDIYLGNGVSELIQMSMQALLDDGDEVLVPAPGLPAVDRRRSPSSGGTAVHYRCDEQSDWMPDLADIERKVTDRTKALVDHQPEQPDGRRVRRGAAARADGHRPPAQPDRLLRRDLRQDPLRRRHAHADRRGRPRPADPHLQRAVEGVPGGGLPRRLDGGLRPEGARRLLHRGPDDPRQHAAVREHARAARGRHRARRPAVDQGPGAARRTAAGAAGHGVRAADPDPRRDLREAEGCAVRSSRGSTPRSTRSRTTGRWCSTCCGPRRS